MQPADRQKIVEDTAQWIVRKSLGGRSRPTVSEVSYKIRQEYFDIDPGEAARIASAAVKRVPRILAEAFSPQ